MLQHRQKIRLYLLAHSDDELFCIPLLMQKEYRHIIIILGSPPNEFRYNETKNFFDYLSQRGIRIELLPGVRILNDGLFYQEIDSVLISQLQNQVESLQVSEVVTSSYEGGHQDHDSIFVVAYLLSTKLQVPLWEFSTYREGKIFPYRVMKKIVHPIKLNYSRRTATRYFIGGLLFYKSQWRTWLGLGLFVFLRYASKSSKSLGKYIGVINLNRTNCLYELRNRAISQEVISRLQFILSSVDKGESQQI